MAITSIGSIYVNAPPIALSQPDATYIELAAVAVSQYIIPVVP